MFLLMVACAENPSDRQASSDKNKENRASNNREKLDLEAIQKRDTLRAVVNNSSTSYFIYRGQPMGFEYELLNRLSDHLDVFLKVIIEQDISKALQMLESGKADIVAHKLAPEQFQIRRGLAFTDAQYTIKQVLVQHKPENWRYMPKSQVKNYLLRNPKYLEGEKVNVKKNSPHLNRLQTISDTLNGKINIIEEDGGIDTETLIKRVAEGKIEYTVADNDVAKVNQSYYPILDIKTELSEPREIAWAVRKESSALLQSINEWLQQIKRKPDYNVIYRKYFVNRRNISDRADSEITTINEANSISNYDKIIKEQAKKLGWDWKLLAALIYEESRFDYNEVSWMGAVGLMQLIPSTAASFGNYNLYEPRQNIAAGTEYLKWLQNFWKPRIPNEKERLRFILASYNAGQGHVLDAMRLAEKYGRNPYIWAGNVEYYLLQKSKPKFYTDPVVKMGYCRGEEPVNYVEDILQVYDRYTQLVKV